LLRKYRWYFSIGNVLDSWTAKTFARPTRTFEEIAIDYINTKRWLAGKHTWNDVVLELYNPITPSAVAKVHEWVKRNFNEINGVAGYFENYCETIRLKMLDPAGNVAEEWEIGGAWPREVNYNDLDYASSDAATVTMTIRYNSAKLLSVIE
jgi:hypothetical protein